MNYQSVVRNIGYGGLVGWIAFIVLFFLVLFILGLTRHVMYPSSQTVALTELSRTHEIAVYAPVFPFRTGNVSVLYEGVISADAKLEITSGQNAIVIPLPVGKVSGSYGGMEEWVDDLSVRYVPSGQVRGTLKIIAVCGRSHTREEREWYLKLHEQQRGK